MSLGMVFELLLSLLALKGQNQKSVKEFIDVMDFYQRMYWNLFYVVISFFYALSVIIMQ